MWGDESISSVIELNLGLAISLVGFISPQTSIIIICSRDQNFLFTRHVSRGSVSILLLCFSLPQVLVVCISEGCSSTFLPLPPSKISHCLVLSGNPKYLKSSVHSSSAASRLQETAYDYTSEENPFQLSCPSPSHKLSLSLTQC